MGRKAQGRSWRCRDLWRVASPWLDTVTSWTPSSTSCLTIVPPVQLTNIFIIAGQVSGLGTIDMKALVPSPGDHPPSPPTPANLSGSVILQGLASHLQQNTQHHLLGDHWFLGCGVWDMFFSRARTVSGSWQGPWSPGKVWHREAGSLSTGVHETIKKKRN